ncbi:hypothetical protein Tco_0296808 [Tanacetum coccineum]
MARPLFNQIVEEVTSHSSFFHDNIDCTGKEDISPLLKCTFEICLLAYDIVLDFLEEYLQMSTRTSLLSLDHFCTSVMKIFVTSHSLFFHDNIDCTRKEDISPLLKCTFEIRLLAYDIVLDFLEEYLPNYLRKPTMTDVVKLYQHHEESTGFQAVRKP